MTITVLTVRSLPLPPLKARGEDIRIVPLSEGAADAEVLIATGTDPVGAATIAALPKSVGLIANFGVGTDNIDLDAAAARGIRVSNTPVVTEDTADLAFALILAATRRIAAADRYVRAGQWTARAAFPLGQRVHGARLGIVGFGAIGQAVARRAAGFSMKVSYWARSPKDEGASLGAAHVPDLGELVAGSDIVSIHLPLTSQTRHLFGADLLGRFKPGAVLVNTGRGPLIDEAALVTALEAGTIGAAGLDVFEHEPQVDPHLLTMDQVVLAPHIGSATGPCRADMAARAIGNVIAFLETGEPRDRVV
ncbi:MAG: D-glycerate dehydrogenase [Proteobacteria bacterium]|nr:D-glycerate dehydrogenase [Pseudomonadota bacterium]